MFAGVAEVPPDAIFDISRRYKEDGSETKLNLGVGAYRTDTGEPYVLNVVKKAEQQIVDNLKDDTMNLEYLPIDGYAPFREGTVRLILGSESPAIADGRVACCQALSGTGALRMGGIFIANNLGTPRQSHTYRARPQSSLSFSFGSAKPERQTLDPPSPSPRDHSARSLPD